MDEKNQRGRAKGGGDTGFESRSTEDLLDIVAEHSASILDRMETLNVIVSELRTRMRGGL